jgi:branched-subunit amino acid transport protein
MRIWLSVGLVTVATWLMKAAGPLLVGKRRLSPRFGNAAGLAAPALLAALLISEVLGEHWTEIDWATIAGLAAGGTSYLLKAPMLVAVLIAITGTALLRLV